MIADVEDSTKNNAPAPQEVDDRDKGNFQLLDLSVMVFNVRCFVIQKNIAILTRTFSTCSCEGSSGSGYHSITVR